MSSITAAFILFPFLTVALPESDTRKASVGPCLNNTEVYMTNLLVLTYHTQDIVHKTNPTHSDFRIQIVILHVNPLTSSSHV